MGAGKPLKDAISAVPPGGASGLRIERYSPHCLLGTVEAVVRHRYGIPGLGRLWLGHAMGFSRSGPRVELAQDGISLNVEFGRVPIADSATVAARLERYFGIIIQHKGYRVLDRLLDDLAAFFDAGEPVVCDLDCHFLRGWREYHAGFNQHSMVLYGRDGGDLLASEQMLGLVRFPREDLADNFRYAVEERNKDFILVRVRRTASGSRRIDRPELLRDLAATVENLFDRNGGKGILALEEFSGALSAFKSEVSGRPHPPFQIPGIWALSHEARHSIKFLKDLEADLPAPGLPELLKRMVGQLDELHERWLEVDANIEAGLHAGSPDASWKAVDCVGKLVGAEKRMAGLYAELLGRLGSGTDTEVRAVASRNGSGNALA